MVDIHCCEYNDNLCKPQDNVETLKHSELLIIHEYESSSRNYVKILTPRNLGVSQRVSKRCF